MNFPPAGILRLFVCYTEHIERLKTAENISVAFSENYCVIIPVLHFYCNKSGGYCSWEQQEWQLKS